MGSTAVNSDEAPFDGKLNKTSVSKLKFDGKTKTYWSGERASKGLGVRVTAKGKSVVAFVGVNGDRKFRTFGVVCVASPFAMLEKQALKFIQEQRGLRVRKDKSRPDQPLTWSLQQALDHYCSAPPKPTKPGTLAGYREHIARGFPDHLDGQCSAYSMHSASSTRRE